ncbi:MULTISPECIES: hypothetical protein [Xanthomonas translucens group]|jgi:hypothetical protein|nr:hypothetical protein [Xanthomonas translucens]
MHHAFALASCVVPPALRRTAALCAGINTGITIHTIRPVRPVVFA